MFTCVSLTPSRKARRRFPICSMKIPPVKSKISQITIIVNAQFQNVFAGVSQSAADTPWLQHKAQPPAPVNGGLPFISTIDWGRRLWQKNFVVQDNTRQQHIKGYNIIRRILTTKGKISCY
jgi:hypothetical protein